MEATIAYAPQSLMYPVGAFTASLIEKKDWEIELREKQLKSLRIANQDLSVANIELKQQFKYETERTAELQKKIDARQAYLDDAYDQIAKLKYRIARSEERAKGVVRRSFQHNHVLTTVCNYCEIPIEKIVIKDRSNAVKNCRHLLCYALRRYTTLSCIEVAELVGLNDHTSVLHAVRRIERESTLDDSLLQHINNIGKLIIGEKQAEV